MANSLDDLILAHRDSLVDLIVKDAIHQIPAYKRAPIQLTIRRVDEWIEALSESIALNDPDILEQHLIAVAGERQEEGYAVMELHSIVHLTEEHVAQLIDRSVTDRIERNALTALLEAVMGAARMVLTVRYLLVAANSKARSRA